MSRIVDPRQEQILAPVYRRGDRLMLGMLGLHMLFAIWFGVFYETWLETWTIGGLALGIFVMSMVLQPGAFVTRCVAGISLQAFVALHIYQLHGLAEMHFFFFTAFAAMIAYQDWRCMWPGALLIIAQHVLFAIMHNQGVNMYFYEGDYVGVTKLGFHFGIALLHVVLCNLWATLLRHQTIVDEGIRHDLALAQAKAERVSLAKTEFLGNMSHEMRTPMAGVLGLAELLLEQDLTPEQRESIGVIRNSAKALVDIVNDALDLSRVEAGKLELHEAPMDLRRLAEEIVELLQPRADEFDVELVVRWQPGGPAKLLGDAGRWRQILLNLVGNAIKFAPGGTVLLDVEVEAARVGESARVVVRVEDDGKGIPADVLPKLFQRFEQGGAATFGAHGGSGLGLAICRELTTLMGGELTVHSVQGAGATFVMRAAAVVAEEAETPPLAMVRTMLIGTKETTLAVLAEQIEAMGSEAVVVADAHQARAAFGAAPPGSRPFDLLLVEPALRGELDGFADLSRIVLLGRRCPELTGERIPWLSRHGDLQAAITGNRQTPLPARRERVSLGLHVLLVEDDAVCAMVATKMLSLIGCSVCHAANGAIAIELFRDDLFDVVLMDCRMPVMDGYKATKAIRDMELPGARVPILALSANSLPEDRAECFRAGADQFLTKPVKLEELTAALQQLVGAREPATTIA